MTIPPQDAARHLDDPHAAGGHYFCPQCLKSVPAALAQRHVYHEACASGALDVTLLRCPVCKLALAAEPEPPVTWAHGVA